MNFILIMLLIGGLTSAAITKRSKNNNRLVFVSSETFAPQGPGDFSFYSIDKADTIGIRFKKEQLKKFQINEDTTQIDLSNQRIKYLETKIFRNFDLLEILLLDGNRIETFDFDLLDHLENLKSLSLYNNRLKCLNEFPLSNLPQLVNLDLSFNKIGTVS
jgi:Leucine-rich repeat (LRR) protein